MLPSLSTNIDSSSNTSIHFSSRFNRLSGIGNNFDENVSSNVLLSTRNDNPNPLSNGIGRQSNGGETSFRTNQYGTNVAARLQVAAAGAGAAGAAGAAGGGIVGSFRSSGKTYQQQSMLEIGKINSSRPSKKGQRARDPENVHTHTAGVARVIDKRTGQDVTPRPLIGEKSAPPIPIPRTQHESLTTAAAAGAATTTTTGKSALSINMPQRITSRMESARSFVEDEELSFSSSQFDFFTGTNVPLAGKVAPQMQKTLSSAQTNGSDGETTIRKQTVKKEWSEKELRERITVQIRETETIQLLHVPSIRVWSEDPILAEKMNNENSAYQTLIERHKNTDRFVGRMAQTFNNSKLDKEMQVSPPTTRDASCNVTTWNIYDNYEEKNEANDDLEIDLKFQQPSVGATSGTSSRSLKSASSSGLLSTQVNSMLSSRSTTSVSQSITAQLNVEPINAILNPKPELEKVYETPAFKKAVQVTEEAVLQNILHNKHLLYRNSLSTDVSFYKNDYQADDEIAAATAESITNVTPDEPPKLVPLWSFSCPQLSTVSVTSLSWNKKNTDLLAAGYGSLVFDRSSTSLGYVAFWSLKNPSHPHRLIKTKSSVTSLSFSEEMPFLLAVGLHDGNVLLFDVRLDSKNPIMQSQHATGKHREAVWGIQWVYKERTKQLADTHDADQLLGTSHGMQQLLTVSGDGRVKQWSMKKGLQPRDVMQLKRVANKAALQDDRLEGISRDASPLCFDFFNEDTTQYLCGTEDGLVHKCSLSYNEQTLENYYGHTGPCYKVKINPFLDDAFITCSADWTLNLWSVRSTQPILKFSSGEDYVMDVEWSRSSSTMFVAVTRDGRLELWDIEMSSLDPILRHKCDCSYVCVTFAPETQVAVAGRSDGTIELYRIEGMDTGDTSANEGERLLAVMENSQST